MERKSWSRWRISQISKKTSILQSLPMGFHLGFFRKRLANLFRGDFFGAWVSWSSNSLQIPCNMAQNRFKHLELPEPRNLGDKPKFKFWDEKIQNEGNTFGVPFWLLGVVSPPLVDLLASKTLRGDLHLSGVWCLDSHAACFLFGVDPEKHGKSGAWWYSIFARSY